MEKLSIQTAPGHKNQVWFANQGQKLAIYHHGVPKPRPLTADELAVFAEFGYSVACPVRDGYLDSSPTEPHSMAADCRLASSVAKELGFDTFISIGFSGGGPRALVDLALNEGAQAGATIGSVAAPNFDFDYFGSWPEEEAEMFEALKNQGVSMLPMFEEWSHSSPELNVGAAGWLCDEIAMVSDWGFDPATIKKPLLVIASPEDQNVPLSHSGWIAGRVPGAQLLEVAGDEHDALVNPTVIRQILERIG